jgi:hypothetical protein
MNSDVIPSSKMFRLQIVHRPKHETHTPFTGQFDSIEKRNCVFRENVSESKESILHK